MIALITGAAGGLGRAMAGECASRGYTLILNRDAREDALGRIRDGIARQYGVEAHAFACDLTSKPGVEALMEYIDRRSLKPDMLFNVAGIDYEGPFLQKDCEELLGIVRLNIEATMRITHEALRRRQRGRRFYIINVSSLASLYPIPLKATYAASKRFLLDFSIALGRELRRENVRVLALCPGGLATTREALRGIAAQGFWGSVTTNQLSDVARRTVSRALRGAGRPLHPLRACQPRAFCLRAARSRQRRRQPALPPLGHGAIAMAQAGKKDGLLKSESHMSICRHEYGRIERAILCCVRGLRPRKRGLSMKHILASKKDFLMINLGLFIVALGVHFFKVPNHFAIGGTTGVSIIFAAFFPALNVGAFMFIVNALLVIVGFIFLGKNFTVGTIYSSLMLSLMIWLLELTVPLTQPLTGDKLLELCFAVILPALGSGIVFNLGASTAPRTSWLDDPFETPPASRSQGAAGRRLVISLSPLG
jgi:short-subunit dehydrogenase